MATRGLRRAAVLLRHATALSRRPTPALALTCRRISNEAGNGAAETQLETENISDDSSVKIHDNPYHGIAVAPFSQTVVDVLIAPVNEEDIEITPDGLIYLPEIKYRRILNQSFGPGGWALLPRGEIMHFQNEAEGSQLITREYALYCNGRFVAMATGEHAFYSKSNLRYGKACESAKSNALMRCCKDLGVASELWDPQYNKSCWDAGLGRRLVYTLSVKKARVHNELMTFVREWKRRFSEDVWCENARTKEKRKLWRRKDSSEEFAYPWKEGISNRTGMKSY